MTVDLKKLVQSVDLGDLNDTSNMLNAFENRRKLDDRVDCIEEVERIVAQHNGDVHDVFFVDGPSWDMIRLDIATDPQYTERCRNHPYFQDLLGQSYGGKVFE